MVQKCCDAVLQHLVWNKPVAVTAVTLWAAAFLGPDYLSGSKALTAYSYRLLEGTPPLHQNHVDTDCVNTMAGGLPDAW